jgi:hypothetical protein
MRVSRLIAAVGWVAGVACAGDGTGLDEFEGDGAVTLEDVQPVFSGNCAFSGCHAGASPAQGMNLGAGQTSSNVVNVASRELPTMNRVTPNQPDNSYLVHKIQGTHVDVGGSGSRMPLGRSPLSRDEIDLIRAWIEGGARAN